MLSFFHQVKDFFVKPYYQSFESLTEFKEYLLFLNNLGYSTNFIAVLKVTSHKTNSMVGWRGLELLTCLSQENEIYDIDIRYAWNSIIFKQNLVDHDWTEKNFLE